MITMTYPEFCALYPHLSDEYVGGSADITPRASAEADDVVITDADCVMRGRLSWDEGTVDEVGVRPNYRAYDTTTEWQSAPKTTMKAARRAADMHNESCRRQGGHGNAIVVAPIGGRLHQVNKLGLPNPYEPIWPPHGRTHGAARARNP